MSSLQKMLLNRITSELKKRNRLFKYLARINERMSDFLCICFFFFIFFFCRTFGCERLRIFSACVYESNKRCMNLARSTSSKSMGHNIGDDKKVDRDDDDDDDSEEDEDVVNEAGIGDIDDDDDDTSRTTRIRPSFRRFLRSMPFSCKIRNSLFSFRP